MTYNWLGVEAMVQSITRKQDVNVDEIDSTFFYPEPRVVDSLPLLWPNVAINFSTRPREDVLRFIEECGATSERIGNNKFETWTVVRPDIDMLQGLSTIPEVNLALRVPNNSISPFGLSQLVILNTRLATILQYVNAAYDNSLTGSNFEVRHNCDAKARGCRTHKEKVVVGDAPMGVDGEEGEVVEAEELTRDWETISDSYFEVLSLMRNAPKSWGSVEERPVGPGFFIPYEPNYAQPDPSGIKSLVQRFSRLFYVDRSSAATSIDQLLNAWVTEIQTTEVGMHLAHLMASLEIAVSGGFGIYALFRGDGVYEGSVLRGEGVLMQVGMVPETSKSATDLTNDITSYGFHATSLAAVLQSVDSDVEPSEITSMRELREVVMAGGMPSGSTKNMVEKHLKNLYFPDKPLGINKNSLSLVFGWLRNPTAVIPTATFLHRDDFFTEDRTRLVLSAFGTDIPCFSFGGPQTIRATPKIGKGTLGVSEYRAEPPTILQVVKMPMATALPRWNAMLQTGVITTNTTQRISDSRAFSGREKGEMWTSLRELLDETVVERGIPQPAVDNKRGEVGQKRRRDDRDDEGRATLMSRFLWVIPGSPAMVSLTVILANHIPSWCPWSCVLCLVCCCTCITCIRLYRLCFGSLA